MSDVKKFYENESRNSDNNTNNNGTQNMKLALASVTDDEIEALTGADLEFIRANKEKFMRENAKAEIEKKKQLDEKKKKQKETAEKIADAGADITIGFIKRLLGFMLYLAAITKFGFSIIFKNHNVYQFQHVLSQGMMNHILSMPSIIAQKNNDKIASKYEKKAHRESRRAYVRSLSIKQRISMYAGVFFIIFAAMIMLAVGPWLDHADDAFNKFINSPILKVVFILVILYVAALFIGTFIAPAVLTAKRKDKPGETYDEKVQKWEDFLNKNYEEKLKEIESVNVTVELKDLTREDKAEYILQRRGKTEN